MKGWFKVVILGTALGLALMVQGCGQKKEVLAKVGGEVITLEDFQDRIDKLPLYYRVLAREQKERFLEEMINEVLFLEEAHKRGLHRNPEVKDLINETTHKILIAKLIDEELAGTTQVTDKDVEHYYESYKDEYVTSERLRASHILVETEQEAKEILAQLEAGADFAQLARERSIDTSRERGGDLGYFTEGQLIPDFEAACYQLEVGRISGIIKTQFGYHIIKLTDRQETKVKDLAQVKEQIRRQIADEKKRESLNKFVQDLRAAAKIIVNKDLLRQEEGEEEPSS